MKITYNTLYEIAKKVRQEIMNKYGFPEGNCVESSERIQEELEKIGLESTIVEGWVQYDDWIGCTDRSYDEHTWLVCEDYIIDATGDQFNHYMYDLMPEIYISYDLPKGWCIEEPENLMEDDD